MDNDTLNEDAEETSSFGTFLVEENRVTLKFRVIAFKKNNLETKEIRVFKTMSRLIRQAKTHKESYLVQQNRDSKNYCFLSDFVTNAKYSNVEYDVELRDDYLNNLRVFKPFSDLFVLDISMVFEFKGLPNIRYFRFMTEGY